MKRYGLIGRTLKHSFSQNFFTKKFEENGITDCVYQNFELATIDEFPQLLKTYPDSKGFNVTIPYKEEILPFLTNTNEVVKEIGACNCIKVEGDSLTGYNTDVVGFRNSLESRLKPHHKKALILGTGGAAKAIRYVLSQLGIEYVMVSRRKGEHELGYEDLGKEVLADHYLIINTTPLGMYPNVNANPPIPYEYLTPKHFLYDLIYNPEKTKFMAEGEKRGAQTCNGYEMLIGQAEESWRIWNSSEQ
ncbi:MAG TPA: shikimate dehydrogenase [Flavisolibacter sp.]|nr:shikimate dehydrogenase [Flavisolibacter sp.]